MELKKYKIIIKGMMCTNCENYVKSIFETKTKSKVYDINHKKNYLIIESLETDFDENYIKQIIELEGYEYCGYEILV